MLYDISFFICIAYYLYVGLKPKYHVFYHLMKNNTGFTYPTKILINVDYWVEKALRKKEVAGVATYR
jgi:hypothetical protein